MLGPPVPRVRERVQELAVAAVCSARLHVPGTEAGPDHAAALPAS